MTEYLTRETATEELCDRFYSASLSPTCRRLRSMIDAGWRIAPPEPEWTVVEDGHLIWLHRHERLHLSFNAATFTVEAVQAMADVLNG